MMPKCTFSVVLLLVLTNASSQAQIREHTRPGATTDPARARYRLGGNVKGATELSNDQASDVNLTLNEVAVRPIQTWVRTAGRIDKTQKIVSAFVPMLEASFVKVGQRVRAFPPESKSSMFQAWVTKVTPQVNGSTVEITLSGLGHENSTNYVVEIVTERGEFLSIPNEAIIEEGAKRMVYVQKQPGQYVPTEIRTGIQGELYTAVAEGLKPGDQVVSFGSFFVDAEYKLKSTDQSSMSNDQQHHQ
jgi:hypothetical protein